MAKKSYVRNNVRKFITEAFLVKDGKQVGHFNTDDDLPSNQYMQIEPNFLELLESGQIEFRQRLAYDKESDENEDDFDLTLAQCTTIQENPKEQGSPGLFFTLYTLHAIRHQIVIHSGSCCGLLYEIIIYQF